MFVKFLFALYNFVFILALPLVFLRLFWRGCRLPAYRSRWLERLGWFSHAPQPGGFWVHAVSVGEAAAAVPLIEGLLQKYPELPITVTTTTPTGSQRIRQALGNQIFHVYCPYDLPWFIDGFLKRVQPSMTIIMETELWPNLLRRLRQKNIPVVLANARLSPSSFKGYERLATFSQVMLEQVTCIAAQSEADAEKFRILASDGKDIQVTGNVKYDIALSPQGLLDSQLQSIQQRPVWIAASTHAHEEQKILQAHTMLLKHVPDALLILVPRHPTRFCEVKKILMAADLSFMTRSEGSAIKPSHQVLLADTMGELATLYQQARIAFVGGSLVPVGGHNLLEPASLGLPILSGPFLHNFKAVSESLLAENALLIVSDVSALFMALKDLWFDRARCENMGQQALKVVKTNQGAVEKTIALIDAHRHSA